MKRPPLARRMAEIAIVICDAVVLAFAGSTFTAYLLSPLLY